MGESTGLTMQTKIDFFNPPTDAPEYSLGVAATAKEVLVHMINTVGVCEFKDFYIGVKYERITRTKIKRR